MEHSYYLHKRDGGGVMPMTEESIKTLIYYGEIRHSRSAHVSKDVYMSHYFEFKEI